MPTLERLRRRRRILRRAHRRTRDIPLAGYEGLRDRLRDFRRPVRRRIGKLTRRIQRQRAKPDVVVTRLSPYHSDRSSSIRLIVLHSSESRNIPGSSADLGALGSFFANNSGRVSAHVATDGDGKSARYVRDEQQANHVASFNPVSLGIEQIGFASQTSWPDKQLNETARWIAVWSKRHGIPIQRGAVSGSAVTRSGVVTHAQLGVPGGNHSDPGPSYPFDAVLSRARVFRRRL